MRRITLIINPTAGGAKDRQQHLAQIKRSLEITNNHVQTLTTTAPNQAAHLARQACNEGADIVFACGGDGTIHEVLQGMVHQPQATMGIIPLGSANALARHLNLPLDPLQAMQRQLHWQPRTIPAGELRYRTPQDTEATRFFCVMAGAGPDGALVYNMRTTSKHSLGRLAYYLRAASLFATSRFPAFGIDYEDPQGNQHHHRVVSAMAVRVGDLGGLFSPLIRGGALHQSHLTLSLVQTPAFASLPAWFAMSWARLHRFNKLARIVEATSFHGTPLGNTRVHIQADGEWLGYAPMSVRLVPNALRLLMPADH